MIWYIAKMVLILHKNQVLWLTFKYWDLFVKLSICRTVVLFSLMSYLRDRGLDAEAWLGSTPALRARSEALARDLFQCFADRSPTLADRAKLLPLVTVAAGAERRWDEDRADLLRYAFEQAALSGAGGSWPYIEGVLQRLRQRGIETLEQAEDYEWGREA